jgi:uncharacterized protein YbjT (DUF2867 family)
VILVVGATGYLGGEICGRLRERGKAVRALVRDSSDRAAIERLTAAGSSTVVGDLRDSASLERACEGAETVISTATITRSRQPGDSIEATDQAGQLALVEAARSVGVERFVYISYSGNIGRDDPLTTAKRSVEERIRASGMAYTILRPSIFMEFWLGPLAGFDYANRKATIYGDGENRISWISLADVAEFTVRSIDEPAARNATLELGGPEALSPNDVVHLFEELSGSRFDVQHVPVDALRQQELGATDSLGRAFAALMQAYAAGDVVPMEATLEQYPVQMTTVRDYARRCLSS